MKNLLCIIPLAVLLCFAFACQNKAEKAELEKFRAQAKVEEQNKALVKQYLEALDSGSVEKALVAADATLAPDIISHLAEGDSEGIEHIKNNLKSEYESWADIQHPIEQITAEGDIVVTRITWKGKQNGIFMGIPATGKEISFPLMYVFRFEGGKIKERWLDYDSLLSAMTQLGMELKPKEAEKK